MDPRPDLIEKIQVLYDKLLRRGEDLSRIPKVTTDTTIVEITMIHKLLQHKWDHRERNDSFIGLMGAMAYGLQYLLGRTTNLELEGPNRNWAEHVSQDLQTGRMGELVDEIDMQYNPRQQLQYSPGLLDELKETLHWVNYGEKLIIVFTYYQLRSFNVPRGVIKSILCRRCTDAFNTNVLTRYIQIAYEMHKAGLPLDRLEKIIYRMRDEFGAVSAA